MGAAGMQAVWAKLSLADAVLQVFRYVGDDARLQAIFDKERGRCYERCHSLSQFGDLDRRYLISAWYHAQAVESTDLVLRGAEVSGRQSGQRCRAT